MAPSSRTKLEGRYRMNGEQFGLLAREGFYFLRLVKLLNKTRHAQSFNIRNTGIRWCYDSLRFVFGRGPLPAVFFKML